MEDDRVILLDNNSEDLNFTDPTGMFSLTEMTEDDNPDENNEKDEDDHDASCVIYVAAVIAALGGLLFGYDIGVISGAKIQIQKEIGLTCLQTESIVAMLPVGAMIASLVAGGLVDKYGRKNMIIANALVFVCGALMISGTSTFIFFLIGRFILGFAVALSAIAECIYISELSVPSKRGMLVSFNELAITVGILIAFLVNYCLADIVGGWRIMFSLSIGIAIIQGLAMLFLPQTPQFLMIKKNDKAAEAVLRKLKLTTNIRQSMADIRLAIADQDSGSIKVLFSSLNNMNGRMLIGFGLVIAQQITGQPNIIYYAADVFKAVGFCTEWSSTLASVGLGTMKVISTAISLSFVDRIGRKKCLVIGVTIMGLAVFILGLFAITDGSEASQPTCQEFSSIASNISSLENSTLRPLEIKDCPISTTSVSLRVVAFLAMVIYVCAFSFGFGPVTWIVLSEIFPPSLKGRAMALVTSLNWALNFVISATFLQLTDGFTLGGLYIIYAILCLVSIVFVILVVPETKGKSLEEISRTLKNKKIIPWKRKCCPRKKNNPNNSRVYRMIDQSA